MLNKIWIILVFLILVNGLTLGNSDAQHHDMRMELLHNNIIDKDTTWSVCLSGCEYNSPLEAWNHAILANFFNGAILTINIKDGLYQTKGSFYTETDKTKYIKIIGDTKDNSKVVLLFNDLNGTNKSGFSAYNGGKIGLIDGVTINGFGALSGTDKLGRHSWNKESYGSGVISYGAGSNIKLGNHVSINKFYYGVTADNNGGVDAPDGGVSVTTSGDVNFMARGGGVIVCTPCKASDVSDYTDPKVAILGSNYDAERGGSLYIDGSTGSSSLVNSIVGLTGGHIWAHKYQALGGLNKSGNAVGAWENSSLELTDIRISGYENGIQVTQSSWLSSNNAVIEKCTKDGIQIDGGVLDGNKITIKDNGGYGINVFHQGIAHLYNSINNIKNNKYGVANVEKEGEKNGYKYIGSSLLIQ